MGFMRPLRPYGGTYHPKFNFATVDQLTQEAQAAGLVVEKCYDFERPTPLKAGEQGLANWARQFFASELASFSPVEQDEILAFSRTGSGRIMGRSSVGGRLPPDSVCGA